MKRERENHRGSMARPYNNESVNQVSAAEIHNGMQPTNYQSGLNNEVKRLTVKAQSVG
jgi:hypothetical protein